MPASDDELREFVRGLRGGFQPSFMDGIREQYGPPLTPVEVRARDIFYEELRSGGRHARK
jgi:hypothetical protein